VLRGLAALASVLAFASSAAAATGTIVFTRGHWSATDHGLTDGDLYAVSADGSNLRDLTPADTDTIEIGARWSPGGKRIAFVRALLGSRDQLATLPQASLWTMNADGGGQRRLTGDLLGALARADVASSCAAAECAADFTASWSPRGRSLVYARGALSPVSIAVAPGRGVPTHLWTMRADGSHKRQLTRGSYLDTEAAWSPTGRWIVFYRRSLDGLHGALYLIRPDGTGLHPLELGLHAGTQPLPAWSPDGTRVVWSTGGGGLVVADGRTGRTIRLGGGLAPSWGRGGVVFQSVLDQTLRSAIATIGLDGTSAKTVTTPPAAVSDVFPAIG